MDELIRLVVTSKAYTEALNSGITITMSIINGYEDMFPQSWLLVIFDKDYYHMEHIFNAEEYARMISPEIAAEKVLRDMRKEVESCLR
jgi:hypothetical protein